MFICIKKSILFILFIALALISIPISANDLSVEFEIIARSGVTSVPGGNGPFLGFGDSPAIDDQGNVVFTGGGGGQAGIYTAIGSCCQKVADLSTDVPGGGGANFADFYGSETVDIDNGRVAFKAINQYNEMGLYSNVGQASASHLAEIAVIDGVQWASGGDPWVDGDTVAMYGEYLVPSSSYRILKWNGVSGTMEFLDPGAGFFLGYNSQASVSGDASIFARVNSQKYEIGISDSGGFESLAVSGVTPMPGLNGVLFDDFF